MKRTTVKEIYIEIETIRVTRRRSAREKSPTPDKSGESNRDDSMIKTDQVFEHSRKRIF